jgi:hypothetical protein
MATNDDLNFTIYGLDESIEALSDDIEQISYQKDELEQDL